MSYVVGMGLMFWGAVAAERRKPYGAGVLAVGWSWTASLFWRATTDRYWYASLGQPLHAGTAELWLAPILTILTLVALAGSLVLLVSTEIWGQIQRNLLPPDALGCRAWVLMLRF